MERPTALVTGASGGIGLELARLLAADGHDLVLTARSGDKLQALAGELRSGAGVECRVVPVDLALPGGAADLAAVVADLGTPIDVLVNNAGFGLQGGFLEIELDEQLALLQLNVVALTELAWRFGRPMAERGRGRILNVASTAAFQPGPWMAAYYASKAYVLSLSDALASELEGSGVGVTALCPGPTATGFAERAEIQKARLFRAGVMDAETVARAGYRGLMRDERRVVPGWSNRIGTWLVRFAPSGLVLRAVARMNRP